jgi:hypothetical protein
MPSSSNDIHYLIPNDSNAFRSFLSEQTSSSGFHVYITALMSFLPYSKVPVLIAMVTRQCYTNNPNPMLSKSQLKTSNLNNFKIVEAMGLKIIASRSPWMASLAYQIPYKSTKRFKSY